MRRPDLLRAVALGLSLGAVVFVGCSGWDPRSPFEHNAPEVDEARASQAAVAVCAGLVRQIAEELRFDQGLLATRADITQRYANYARGIMGGFLKPNEARIDDGRDPDPAGDTLLEPSNMSTMGSQSSGTGADGGGRPENGSPEQKF